MSRKRKVTVFAAVIALAPAAGCGGDTSAPPPARGQHVTFRSTDGRRVPAVFTPAVGRAPAVVLLGAYHGHHEEWDAFVPVLHGAGFATLALDGRVELDEQVRARDLVGAIGYLRGRPDVAPHRLAAMGSAIGASTAVLAVAARARRDLDAVVALSALDSSRIINLQQRGRYRPHDVLFISDRRDADPARNLFASALRSRLMRSAEPGRGAVLLDETAVRDAVVAWLQARTR